MSTRQATDDTPIESIRIGPGLRDRGQRRGGAYEASKSRTFSVPVARLYAAFANARTRGRWLKTAVEVRSTPNKRMRLAWNDATTVEIGFVKKTDRKSIVAVSHQKLPNKSAVETMKAWWGKRFDALSELLG